MARTRATNYAQKQETILVTAAMLFSREGVERTSMSAIATACGYSKALLYHYYESKEVLLFDIVSRHMALLQTRVSAAASGEEQAENALGAMVQALLTAYAENEDQHRIQLAGLTSLTPEHLEQINVMERELVDSFAAVIKRLMPNDHAKQMLKPVTMSLFGMLNWHYMWFREKGQLSRDDYAALATRLIIHGARELGTDASVFTQPKSRNSTLTQCTFVANSRMQEETSE